VDLGLALSARMANEIPVCKSQSLFFPGTWQGLMAVVLQCSVLWPMPTCATTRLGDSRSLPYEGAGRLWKHRMSCCDWGRMLYLESRSASQLCNVSYALPCLKHQSSLCSVLGQ